MREEILVENQDHKETIPLLKPKTETVCCYDSFYIRFAEMDFGNMLYWRNIICDTF